MREYQGDKTEDTLLYPHNDAVMNEMLRKLFKKLNVSITSHDFRHTKITDLGKRLTPH